MEKESRVLCDFCFSTSREKVLRAGRQAGRQAAVGVGSCVVVCSSCVGWC